MKNDKTYTQLMELETFQDRYNYLKLSGQVAEETFGSERYLNQKFYKSQEWKRIRDYVILRDHGCDLGIPCREIGGKILIHHMNPITPKDILQHSETILDPEYLICVSKRTHDAIHYGSEDLLIPELTFRQPGDTCPWK